MTGLDLLWLHGRELEWAEMAWKAGGEQGLADYHNEVHRTLVMIRLMTLATT